jgi:hypothetical protein
MRGRNRAPIAARSARDAGTDESKEGTTMVDFKYPAEDNATADREYEDPGQPVKSPGAGFRRVTLKDLRAAANTLRWLISEWSVGRQMYTGKRYRSNDWTRVWQEWRYRQLTEYPEQDADKLAKHAARLRRLADEFYRIAESMDDRARGIK